MIDENGMFNVGCVTLDPATGKVISDVWYKAFPSPYLARIFCNKCKHSKRVKVVSQPYFD